MVQAEDGQANALDRAYEAETTARRLEAELVAARTRVGQLEQVCTLAVRTRSLSALPFHMDSAVATET